jgi:hypothetical protein
MGYGDDLMATGIARAVSEQYPGAKMVFGDPDLYHDPGNNSLKVHWSEVFENNPLIVHQNEPVKTVICIPEYPGNRTYINYEDCDVEGNAIVRFEWDAGFRAPRGEIHFTENEKSEASEICLRLPNPFFVIEPSVADKGWESHKGCSPDKWQTIVDELSPYVSFIQFTESVTLRGVHHVITPSFRQACAILACAGGFIGTDGGLHHAAAALDVPAVVLWGHYTSPDILGYTDHWNLREAKGSGCGTTYGNCDECPGSVDKILPMDVIDAVKELINEGRHKASRQGFQRPTFRMVGETSEGGQK